MKYLYRILRLFFCPHKYLVYLTAEIQNQHNGKQVGNIYDLQCKYCGKFKRNNFYV
jgi:hypothetical protein